MSEKIFKKPFPSINPPKNIDDGKIINFSLFNLKSKPYSAKKLCWRILIKDFNSSEIKAINLFELNYKMNGAIYEAAKKCNNFKVFEKEVLSALHEVWSRVQYEIGVCAPFPTVNREQVSKMMEAFKNDPEYYRVEACIEYTKIDVYTQITMNWNHFISYLWHNKTLIMKELYTDYLSLLETKKEYSQAWDQYIKNL